MNKKKFFTMLLFIAILFFLTTLIISSYNLFNWNKDRLNSKKQLNIIKENTEVIEIIDNDNTEIIENKVAEENPYWDYIKMNLINVDFNNLKNINNDVKGWIQVNGTNINYPFVQTNNNSYYLKHSFDKSYNSAGWVFLDYRNKLDGTDKNTIIYAHGRLDKTMFGSLRNILNNNWLNNTNNHIVKLSTEHENTLWQVFSIYRIPTTSDYLQTDFNNNFKAFTDLLINRSSYNFNTTVNEEDKILTLSTCYNDNDKVVLHAKLIKKEVK